MVIVINDGAKFVKKIQTKNDIVPTAFVKHVGNLGISQDIANKLRENLVFFLSIAVFDFSFLLRFWKLSGGMFGNHWKLFGNVDWWIMVMVDPGSNKTLRILLDKQVSMVLHVAMVQ